MSIDGRFSHRQEQWVYLNIGLHINGRDCCVVDMHGFTLTRQYTGNSFE